MNIRTWLIFILLSGMHPAWGLPLLEKIQEISRAPNLSAEQKNTGKSTLLLIVANCEFDEICLVKQMVPLKELFEKEKNPIYVDFVDFIFKNQDTLTKDGERCSNVEKKAVRKIYAECLKKRVSGELQIMPLSTRGKIDKLDDNQDICIKDSMEKLANEGNIYAQAVMVNLTQLMSDSKKMDYWYNQIQKQTGTKRYQDFQNCPEIP